MDDFVDAPKNGVELCCFCVDREPRVKKAYHLELVCRIRSEEDFVYSPDLVRRYELSEFYDTHQEAIDEGTEIVRVFAKCGVNVVHDKLYSPEVLKETVDR